MRPTEIPPFYFPSMVAFVDDSHDFLVNLSLQLDADLAFRLFDSPIDALLALNGRPSRASLVERLFSVTQLDDDISLSHHVLDLHLDTIAREVCNPRRFEQFSVVVVDYDMPEIDGLEFCRSIKDRAIKKILLTGKADEKIAVQAFNKGTIDRFILKQDTDVIPTLNQAISELQRSYFGSMARTAVEALSLGAHRFLCDARFADAFGAICKRLGIVEFYLTASPEGFLMLDADGVASLLVVKTQEDLDSHIEIARDQDAPPALIECLSGGGFVPCFPPPEGEYLPDGPDWRTCLHPATVVEAERRYYYAVIAAPAQLAPSDLVSYAAFLRWMDTGNTTALPVPH